MRGTDGRTPLQRSVQDMRIVVGHRIFRVFAVEEGGSDYKEFERSYFALSPKGWSTNTSAPADIRKS